MEHISSRKTKISDRWMRLIASYSKEKNIKVQPTELMASLSYVTRYLGEIRPTTPEIVDGKIEDMRNIMLWAVGANICSPIMTTKYLKPGVDFNNWLAKEEK